MPYRACRGILSTPKEFHCGEIPKGKEGRYVFHDNDEAFFGGYRGFAPEQSKTLYG